MMITYWKLPNNKSYVRVDRNGINTAMGEAILKSFYPKKYDLLFEPVEERKAFKNIEKQTGKKLVKGTPPENLLAIIPEHVYYNVEGTEEWHPFNKKLPPHLYIPLATEEDKGAVHALIRHPIQRFISFINKYTPELHTYVEGFDITKCVDKAVLDLMNTPETEIFLYNNKQHIPQTTFLNNNLKNIKFYQYPNHLNELILDLKLTHPPVKDPSTLLQSVVLTKAHEEIILNRFKKDLELFENIKYPGIILEA